MTVAVSAEAASGLPTQSTAVLGALTPSSTEPEAETGTETAYTIEPCAVTVTAPVVAAEQPRDQHKTPPDTAKPADQPSSPLPPTVKSDAATPEQGSLSVTLNTTGEALVRAFWPLARATLTTVGAMSSAKQQAG